MLVRELVKKIIDKAVKNGFKVEDKYSFDKARIELDSEEKPYFIWDKGEVSQIATVIFDIRFAKAFFGEESEWYFWQDKWQQEKICGAIKKYNWEYQLQQLVLEKDRLEYLKQFLNN